MGGINMDIYTIKNQLKTNSIYDVELRVTFYARVSTSSDEQLNSLENQVDYYNNLIQKNTKWTLIPGYVDEGISGISTKHREHFNRMIRDAENGLFDLIITKEISRFARNTLDSIQYTRKLLSYGVGVFFQNDNINTLDEDSELRLSIMASIAQDELRKLSSRVRFGHDQVIRNHGVLGNNRIAGYDKKNKRLVINEKEAQMVRELFDLYSTDKYSLHDIERIFWERGYRNLNGNRLLRGTLSKMIANPKYKGYYVGNKARVVDLFTKQIKQIPPDQWVMFKDETGEIVPAIVPEEIWDTANRVLQRRSDDVKNRRGICNHENLFTGKMFCTHCGLPYYRSDGYAHSSSNKPVWVCSGQMKNGKNSCPSFRIHESEIKPVLIDLFLNFCPTTEDLLAAYEDAYKKIIDDPAEDNKIKELTNKINFVNKQKKKLLELCAAEKISMSDFESMTNNCNAEIEEYNNRLNQLQTKKSEKDKLQQQIQQIHTVLNKARQCCKEGDITREFVNMFIDRIDVTNIDKTTAKLTVKLFTGETSETNVSSYKRGKKTNNSTESITEVMLPVQLFRCMRRIWNNPKQSREFIYLSNLKF